MTDDLPTYSHPTMADSEDVYEEPTKKGLNTRTAQENKTKALIRLLESWNVEDEQEQQEQREAWEHLKRALDEDRFSDRKLFL